MITDLLIKVLIPILSLLTSIFAPGFNIGHIPNATQGIVASQKTDDVVVNQGDELYIGNSNAGGSFCTLSYVDKTNNLGYTSWHCGQEGDNVAVSTGGGTRVTVGYLAFPDDADNDNDYAAVVFYDNVTAGDNTYSGDTITTDAQVGDTVCRFGMISSRTDCAEVIKIYSNGTLRTDYGINPISGDSGGPAWIEGKGYYGNLEGHYFSGDEVASFPVVQGRRQASIVRHLPLEEHKIPIVSPKAPKVPGGLSSLSSKEGSSAEESLSSL